MAADPLRPARPGDPVGRLRDSATLNAMLDAARMARGLHRAEGGSGPSSVPAPSPNDTVLVVAHQGMRLGTPVGIAGPASSWRPDLRRAEGAARPACTTKDYVHGEGYLVLVEPAESAGSVVRAAASGVVLVRIATPGGAVPRYVLVNCPVLWSETDPADEDERWAAVLLGCGDWWSHAQVFSLPPGGDPANHVWGAWLVAFDDADEEWDAIDGGEVRLWAPNGEVLVLGNVYPCVPAGVYADGCPLYHVGAPGSYPLADGDTAGLIGPLDPGSVGPPQVMNGQKHFVDGVFVGEPTEPLPDVAEAARAFLGVPGGHDVAIGPASQSGVGLSLWQPRFAGPVGGLQIEVLEDPPGSFKLLVQAASFSTTYFPAGGGSSPMTLDTAFAVNEGGSLAVGGSASVAGMTFVGGIYTGGAISAAALISGINGGTF